MLFKKISTSEAITGIAALGLLAGVLLSWPLWSRFGINTFPLLPIFGDAWFDNGSSWGVFFQNILTVALILSAIVFPKRKWLLASLTIWLLWLCCLDINRLQPWVWFYLLVFAAVVFGKKENETSTVNTLRWLLAGVYFWSGFNKLTPYFAEDNFTWFCDAFNFTKPFGQYPVLGYAVALFEMSFAAGLLWKKTRPHVRWIVVGFHTVIVIFLLQLDWNWVVIPWNLAMAGMVWVLNSTPDPSPTGRGGVDNTAETFTAKVTERSTSPLPVGEGSGVGLTRVVIFGLTWLAPILYFFHLWPFTFSWQLYSNTQPEATFYFEHESNRNPFYEAGMLKVWDRHAFDNYSKLLLDDWAADELFVPMFASERAFRQTGEYLCRCSAYPDSAGIYILKVNRWNKSAEKMDKIPCRELMTK